nr:cell division protein HetF [Iningainema tapete]
MVRTEQVAPGVPLAEELVTWPVAEWLTAAGHLMNDPLKSVFQGDAIARNSVNLVALGQQLYNTLFQGTLRDSWITAQGIAQNHQQVLRLRIGLKDTRLARLPWEVMHASDRPLATGPYIAFSRYQSGIGSASRLPSTNMPSPLDEVGIRVLMAIASPNDQVRLDLLKQEAINLQAVLYRNIEDGSYTPQIELTLLEQPGREELTQALEQGRYHVLHYSGHSNVGSNGGEIYLVNNRTGLTETLSGDDLAGLLVNNNIQMAVFNSCLGTYAPTSEPSVDSGERNLTESLVKRGIRSVLAMSERIPDDVALTLTQLFYHNLSQGYPVDLCVSRMRQGLITAYGTHQMYWALPILYLQPEFDGVLSPEIYLSQTEESFDEYDSTIGTTPTIYSPLTNHGQMPLPIEDILPSSLVRGDSTELDDWLGDETWGDIAEEIEYDDPSYAEDSALVSDLFREIDNQKSAPDSHMTAELVQEYGEDNIYAQEQYFQLNSQDDDEEMWAEIRAAAYGRNIETHQVESSLPEAPPPQFEQSWSATPLQTSGTIGEKAQPKRSNRWLSVVGGSVGVAALATVVGLNWWQQQVSKLPEVATQSQPSKHPEVNLKADATGIVTAYATDKLRKGDLTLGLMGVEELLNRNALNNAKAALDSVSSHQADDAQLNFLKGRLAWQSVQAGDSLYSIEDARRFWESAVKANPDSFVYKNALGFAYYTQGKLELANDSWFQALNVAVKQQSKPSASDAAIASQPVPKEALTAYAGLAIGMYKTAPNQPENKRQRYISEAVKLGQKVVKDDPESFQLDKIRKNWLWTQKTVEDWQSLLAQQTPN